ncbi:uncharacterized protein LOC120638619 [Ornithorhynchus anatinus]|uniref:uncharacterized protein LOC120638619 n=1 Tax=Ornithorhynchus anatinus TaxID=9258 RepID=UPI0019D4B8BD|nr:uncharacterized protein LOC120638619 [Ornithorhynchus anatinus]
MEVGGGPLAARSVQPSEAAAINLPGLQKSTVTSERLGPSSQSFSLSPTCADFGLHGEVVGDRRGGDLPGRMPTGGPPLCPEKGRFFPDAHVPWGRFYALLDRDAPGVSPVLSLRCPGRLSEGTCRCSPALTLRSLTEVPAGNPWQGIPQSRAQQLDGSSLFTVETLPVSRGRFPGRRPRGRPSPLGLPKCFSLITGPSASAGG